METGPFGHDWGVDRDPDAEPEPDTDTDTDGSGPAAAPRLGHGDLGYASLWVADVDRAAEFFSAVLGWRYGPASGPGGRHVEGLSVHHGLWGGFTRSTLFCCFAVADVAVAAARVRAAGGTAGRPHREPYGLLADCVDDQGVRFAVFEPPGGVGRGPARSANGSVPGDLAYVTMEVEDSRRARDFYAAVLGWRFSPGSVIDGFGVDGVVPMFGLSGGHAGAATVPLYRVVDVEAAVDRVRAAGGTASDPEGQPYGVTARCADSQSTRFAVGQLR